MRYKDSDLSSPTDIVDAFGEFFDSVYINSDPLYADSLISDIAPQLNVSVDSVTEEDILFALKKSKDTMTAGPDEIIDNRGQVDSIYMDISKAFDQIDHFILLSKLKAYGFSDQLISFFREYLTKREQR
ncbi:uncharacterized protein LOC135122212, partial [Zophobas morio]|uniref:uncharacterized protein LOC135122185 n=1 Tax=Zophobas morio TaxID=2755281 RepID=UPI003083C849